MITSRKIDEFIISYFHTGETDILYFHTGETDASHHCIRRTTILIDTYCAPCNQDISDSECFKYSSKGFRLDDGHLLIYLQGLDSTILWNMEATLFGTDLKFSKNFHGIRHSCAE